jgi:hypothetical protein
MGLQPEFLPALPVASQDNGATYLCLGSAQLAVRAGPGGAGLIGQVSVEATHEMQPCAVLAFECPGQFLL